MVAYDLTQKVLPLTMPANGQESTYIPLRTVTDLLSNSPTGQLPNLIYQLITAVQASKTTLCSAEPFKGSDNASTEAVVLHRFRTQINSLLSGKSPEGRWVAIVLIKTAVELVGWETLQMSGPWVRQMVEIMRVRYLLEERLSGPPCSPILGNPVS
jgi:hypothetical protein